MTDGLAALADPILRVAVGAVLIPHGWEKLRALRGQADLEIEKRVFTQCGLRPATAWIAACCLLQLVGGLMLVLGLFTRPVALAEAVMLLVTVLWTRRRGWFWHRGGMEYSLLWAVAAFVVFCNGADPWTLDALQR